MSKRKVPMEVLNLGLSRTGTRSMHDALKILGYDKVYHGYEIMYNNPPGKYWLNCVEAKYEGKGKVYGREEFDEGLGDYAAVTDTPCCFLWKELMEAYPEAKVILVERNLESWFKSFKTSVIETVFHPRTDTVRKLEPWIGTYAATMTQKVMLGYFHASTPYQMEQNARDVYERHYANIRKACASTPGRLLDFQLADGWEPLCKFLGKEVPNVMFPNVNEAEDQLRVTTAHREDKLREGRNAVLKYVLPPFALCVILWWLLGRPI